jgi:putative transcription factor
MQCELCGREVQVCRPAVVDGVRMMLCPGCMRHGQSVEPFSSGHGAARTPMLDRIKKPRVKDVYRDMDKELVLDWNDRIRTAREQRGLSREELGFQIGERTVTIAKIENGDLRPSDKLVKKLEKLLNITLIEVVKEISPAQRSGSGSSSGLTLGDFIKTEKK